MTRDEAINKGINAHREELFTAILRSLHSDQEVLLNRLSEVLQGFGALIAIQAVKESEIRDELTQILEGNPVHEVIGYRWDNLDAMMDESFDKCATAITELKAKGWKTVLAA